jgi:hypothetical protein
MRKKTRNLYIISIIILILLVVSFFIYNGTIENFEERKGHFMKRDKEGDLEHYSRVPVNSDPKDTFNYGVDTVPGAINEGFQISPPVGTKMTLTQETRNIISHNPLKIYLIFYGDWSYARNTTVKLIENFIADLSESDYLNAAVQSYSGADNKVGSNKLVHAGTIFDLSTNAITFTNTTDAIIERNIKQGKIVLDSLTPSNLMLNSEGQLKLLKTSVFCVFPASTIRQQMMTNRETNTIIDNTKFELPCGYHGVSPVYNDAARTQLRVDVLSLAVMNVHAAAKNPDGTLIRDSNNKVIYPNQNCSTLYALKNFVDNMPNKNSITTTPHNDNVGESILDGFAHEIVEVITDPNASEWMQSANVTMNLPRVGPNINMQTFENADLCAYNYGTVAIKHKTTGKMPTEQLGTIDNRVKRSPNGSYTNVELKPGKRYFLPAMFVKTIRGKAESPGKCLFGWDR